jgi:hypothetical protein
MWIKNCFPFSGHTSCKIWYPQKSRNHIKKWKSRRGSNP